MDDNQFDGLIRALGNGTSRRGALGLLAAAAGLGLREVSAKAKHHKGKDKGKHKQQAQGKPSTKCTPNNLCAQFCARTFGANTPAANQCTSAATKCQGPCIVCGPGAAQPSHPDSCRVGTPTAACCPASQPTCCANHACVDTQTDASNCGTCGNACAADQVCRQGTCVTTCTPTTCAVQGASCGPLSDGCGHLLDCGSCPSDQCLTCSANNTCVSSCTAPDTCGGGGTPGQCGHCTPDCAGKCDGAANGCGGTCDGSCARGQICSSGTCGCAPPPTSSECFALNPPGSECRRGRTTEGCDVCADLPSCGVPDRYPPCTSTADCAADSACIVGSCSVCARLCVVA